MIAGKQSRTPRRLALLAVACAGALFSLPGAASAAPPPDNACEAPVDLGSGLEEYTCYWKPPPVGGYAVEQNFNFNVPEPQVDGWVTHMEVDLVDQNRAPVPINRLMLHHIVFLNLDENDKTCGGYAGFGEENVIGTGNGYAPERFYAAGEERAKISFPDGYGYRMDGVNGGLGGNNKDTWSLTYMFMNHKPTTDTQAWVQYRVTVDTDSTLERVRPYWLDVRNCRADPIYNVPGLPLKARKAAQRSGKKPTNTISTDVTIKEDGWLVGGAGHVHGGAVKLTITKPSCGNKQVAQSVPTWGLANHPFYNVQPVLHEPGPIGMSAFSTQRGIPVRAGQTIRMNSIYDGVRPHTRVMGIFIVYLAQQQRPNFDPGGPEECGGAPAGIQYGPGTNLAGRSGPIPYTIPLTGLDSNGNATTIEGPPGGFRRLKSGAVVTIGDRFFNRPNVRLRRGASLNYQFNSAELHNLTLANGPLGIGSPNLNGGRGFTQRFTRAGTYRFFCGLHPVQMSQRVIVTKKRKKHRRNRSSR